MKSYLYEIKKLAIGEGGNFWIFDPDRMRHCPWDFAEKDIAKMKEAGIQWVIEVCNYSLHQNVRPWFLFSLRFKERLCIDQKDYVFPSLDEISSIQKENIWNVFLWFIKSNYSNEKYIDRQMFLWEDIRRDYEFARVFFKDCSRIHVELLMHHMASVIGMKLGNVEGD